MNVTPGRRQRVFRTPGWLGLRIRRYWVLRDVRRHPLRFSERNGYGCRMLASVGHWQFWRKG